MAGTNGLLFGATLPLVDTGGNAETVRRFGQAAENLGYHHLAAPDHVLGVNAASRPDWDPGRNTSKDLFHDPFVMFGYLAACTDRIGFSTQVLILPQRQTALAAKQAASLDVLSNGRFRLGIGVGWNPVEYTGLNEDFSNRGQRSSEQVEVLRALWAEPHVTFEGKWHHIDDAGINPLPLERAIPVWFGGHQDVTLRRIAKWGDGWIMNAHPLGETANAEFGKLRRYTEEAGRNPDAIGIEVWVSTAEGGPDDWKRAAAAWAEAGVTHVTLNTVFNRGHHRRIEGRSLDDHLRALEDYWRQVEELAA
jgi:probable F420-dependent oxidoreductase